MSDDDDLKLAFEDLLRPLPALGALPHRTAVRARRRRATRLGGIGAAAALAVVGGVALARPSSGPERLLVPAAPARTVAPSSVPSASATAVAPSSAPSRSPAVGPPVTASARASSDPAPPASPATGGRPGPQAGAVPPAATAATVVLQGDGLGLASGTSTRQLTFAGSDAATVREAVRRSLGAGTLTPSDCGAVSVQHDGLVLVLRGARFVGWSATPGSPLRTADGLGSGTTLAALRQARSDVQVSQGTLGPVFTSGRLAGFLDGSADTSTVTSLYAGDVCLAG